MSAGTIFTHKIRQRERGLGLIVDFLREELHGPYDQYDGFHLAHSVLQILEEREVAERATARLLNAEVSRIDSHQMQQLFGSSERHHHGPIHICRHTHTERYTFWQIERVSEAGIDSLVMEVL